MDNKLKKELQILATQIRLGIIEGTYNAKAGHPGGSLSAQKSVNTASLLKSNEAMICLSSYLKEDTT